MQEQDRFFIALPARDKNLAVIRKAVTSHCQKIGIDETTIADLKTTISEACANVVMHAYEAPGKSGHLEVELLPGEAELTVVVRDFGDGVRPHRATHQPSLCIGLAIIGALSSNFSLLSKLGTGTQVRIQHTRP